MKKISAYILLMILPISCVDIASNPEFTVKNESNLRIDSIIIGASKAFPTKLLKVNKEEQRQGKILFNKKITNDGSYFIEVYKNNELLESKNFGYYTNGIPLNKKFDVIIYRDSIIIKEH